MIVRSAEVRDRVAMLALLRDAHAAAGLPFAFSAPHGMALIDRHTADDSLLALVAGETPRAILLASAQPHPFAPILYAAETVWWVAPDARGKVASRMLDAYETWALARGCTFAGMAALATFPQAGIIYQRRGYRAAETHFLKTL